MTLNSNLFDTYHSRISTYHSARKVRQTITDRGRKLIRAQSILASPTLNNDQYDDMKKFNKTSNADFNEAGRNLKLQVGGYISYYKAVQKNAIVRDDKGAVENVDTFVANFIKHYKQDESFRGSLIVCLMRAFVAKSEGTVNPPYGAKVLNFMLAMASGNKKGFEFVSANLCSVSLRHIERLTRERRPPPFIGIDQAEMVNRLKNHFARIREKRTKSSPSLSSRIAFTAGFDGTVLVKSFQILHSSNVIVGGAYPNHYISLPSGISGEELAAFLKGCTDGVKYGPPAAEIKVCVVAVQDTPPGMCPYITLVGRPQSINENNDFGTTVIAACVTACNEDGNAVVLNTTTDGVSSEVQWNLRVMIAFLSGAANYVSLPDTNHNVKNARYQLIGGSSCAVIGSYVIDPWYLKLASISQKLWRIDDFASDAVVLSLVSVKSIQRLQAYTLTDGIQYDVGNYAVTVVSLVFLRLRAYAVNAINLRWRARALYAFTTFLWFSSIQCSTMLANKRNMLLETVGIMFLVARGDVSHPRRTTSECNEHTYGMWRMALREFNVEQLTRIVQKSMIKMDCVFESNLVLSRSNAGLSGYQETLPSFIKSMSATLDRKDCCGPVDVDLKEAAVHQLWNDVKGVIDQGISLMAPFLRLFGIVEGNGLSPFMSKIESPSDLQKLVLAYFASHHGLSGVTRDNSRGENTNVDLSEMLNTHIKDIQSTGELDDADDIFVDDSISDESGQENSNDKAQESASEDEISFDPPILKGPTAYDFLLHLLSAQQVGEVGGLALNLIEVLQLGRLDKGTMSTSGVAKFNSLNGRWFSTKKVTTPDNDGTTSLINGVESGAAGITIRRGSIVISEAENRDKVKSLQHYRVLGIFNKHQNKWYMEPADEVHWAHTAIKPKKGWRIMVSMVRKVGTEDYEDVRADVIGEWMHSAVYCIKHVGDIKGVIGTIVATPTN